MAIRGYVETVLRHEVHGWAYDVDAPDGYLTIVASIDAAPVGTTVANQPRQDLAAVKIGRGDHGFVLTLDSSSRDIDLTQLDFCAIDSRGGSVALPRLKPAEQARPIYKTPDSVSLGDGDRSQFPLFILGTTRSGTTALSLALLKSKRYAGSGEGHVYELFGVLLAAANQYYVDHAHALRPEHGTSLRKVAPDFFAQHIARMFHRLSSDLYDSVHWLDKTPSLAMIELAPRLLESWPNARFVFMKRRGIENIESKKRKFNAPFATRCSEWAQVMDRWWDVRGKLGCAALEIDQMELACEPEKTARSVAAHIELPEPYLSRLIHSLKTDRPEMTGGEIAATEDLAHISWSEQEKVEFMHLCGPTMQRYGYALDRSYRLAQGSY